MFTQALRYTYTDCEYEYSPEELKRLHLAREVQDRRVRQRSIRRQRRAHDRLLEGWLSEPDEGVIPLTVPRMLKPLLWTVDGPSQVSPKIIDFQKICPHSVASAEFKIDNQLGRALLVRFVPEGAELDKSASLSTQVDGFSATALTVLYSKAELGDFQSNVAIHLNGSLAGNCVLCAKVVPLTLSLHPTHLSLVAKDTSLADPCQPGLRGYVRLTNALNAPAAFRWVPVFNEEGGTSFQIRPRNGVVEAYSQLDCQVDYYHAYGASRSGNFDLYVCALQADRDKLSGQHEEDLERAWAAATVDNGGKPPSPVERLVCTAKLPTPRVSTTSTRLTLGAIPLGLASSWTFSLVNSGTAVAFFRNENSASPGAAKSGKTKMLLGRRNVLCCRKATLSTWPTAGLLAVNGRSNIKVTCLAEEIGEFEFLFRVLIYGGRPISIRMSGIVVMPKLEIAPQILNFGGVFVGSHSDLKMTLKNTTSVTMRVTFKLDKYGDFSIRELEEAHLSERDTKTITLAPMQAKEIATTFKPSEVGNKQVPPIYVV
ncbi:hypothetical protein AAHC03_012985 [Spirometra sp. Aus1]